MNIISDRVYKVFKFKNQNGYSYSVGLSKKKQDGTYENAYMPVRFPKTIELPDKAEIIIEKGFITFNKKDKNTYWYIFIQEFKVNNAIVEQKVDKKDDYSEFAEEIKITDEDLPF